MFKLHLVAFCPFGINGLLSDESVAPAFCVLVDLVHPAFINSVPLVVMVWNNTVIGPTAVVIIDHPINVDAVTHIYSQDHCEESGAEKCTCLHSVLSSFILKHAVTVQNLLSGHSVDADVWIFLCYFQENIKDASFPVLPHVPFGTPEHICGVCRLLEIVALVFYQQGNTGV